MQVRLGVPVLLGQWAGADELTAVQTVHVGQLPYPGFFERMRHGSLRFRLHSSTEKDTMRLNAGLATILAVTAADLSSNSRVHSFVLPSATQKNQQLKMARVEKDYIEAVHRLRTMCSTVSHVSDDGDEVSDVLVALAKEMNARAKSGEALTTSEIDDCVHSLQNVAPPSSSIDWDALRSLVTKAAHLPHKEWQTTMESATALRDILLGDAEGLTDDFRQCFHRVLEEGNWAGAAVHADEHNKKNKPWAVLVTGVNGIRKTTSIYQPWITELLEEALVIPDGQEDAFHSADQKLPVGENSFFRQLDHMIATLANEDFQRLYELTDKATGGSDPTEADVKRYSDYKAAIFSRYRTFSEVLGILLIREARKLKSNVMVETSGRDVAMFKYIDDVFPADEYNKLALHFTINDLSEAEKSVDSRMIGEIKDGIAAIKSGDVQRVINANAGGPYGSEVLKGVQADSDKVWEEILSGNADGVGDDWYMATIAITADPTKDWTAHAVKPDGQQGTVFTFGPRK